MFPLISHSSNISENIFTTFHNRKPKGKRPNRKANCFETAGIYLGSVVQVQNDESFLKAHSLNPRAVLPRSTNNTDSEALARSICANRAYLGTPAPCSGPELTSILWMEERIRAAPQRQPLWSLHVQALIFKISSLLSKEPVRNYNGTLFLFCF